MRRLLCRANTISSFAGSVPKDFASAQIAFAYDNAVQIYFRENFSDRLIVTPSPDQLVYVDFIGVEINDVRVVAINAKGLLYEYRHNDTSSFDLGMVPKSCSTNFDSLLFLSDHSLWSYKNGATSLITPDVNFEKVAAARNGMALALYNPGTPNIEILFNPFKDEKCTLPLDGNIKIVEWSTSQYLSLLTVTETGKLQIWAQGSNTYSMHCISEQVLDGVIHYASFVHDFDYSDYIVPLDKPVYRDLLPSLARPPRELIVAIDSRVEVLRQSHSMNFLNIAVFDMDCSDTRLLVCDVRSHYTYGEMRRSYLLANCSNRGLTFSQTGLGATDMTICNIFSVPFLPLDAKNVVKGYEDLVIEMGNGQLFDWKLRTMIDEPTIFNGEIVSVIDNKLTIGEKFVNLSFAPQFWDCLIDDGLVVAVGCETCVTVIVYKTNAPILMRNLENVPNGARSVSIYSKDIFAICTEDSVDCFVWETRGYGLLARLTCPNPKAQFIPNPILSLVVTFETELQYFIIRKDEFVMTKRTNVYPIRQLVLKQSQQMLLALTDSALYQLTVSANEFVLQHDVESDFYLLTAATLADMAVVRKRVEQLPPTADDFRTRDENYMFPSKMPNHFPESFRVYCPLLFPQWEILEQNAQRFALSYALCRENSALRENIPLLSIWALCSKDQRRLVETMQLSSWRSLCESHIPLWASSNHIVKLFVEYLLTKTKPLEKDIDEFLLLCVAVKRIPIAKMVARMFGLVKIADFFANNYGDHDMYVKIQKNAFHAQSVHRSALSAMFFLIVDMKDQALKVLSGNPMLQLLVARLIDCDWKQILKSNFVDLINGFYADWWCGDTEKAQQDLLDYKPPPCDMFSLDVHKYELLREIRCATPNSLLVNMQLIPFYVRRQFAKRVIFASQHCIDVRKSRDRFCSTIRFDFGGDCLALLTSSEDSSEDEEDEHTEMPLTLSQPGNDSSFADAFEREYFVSDLYCVISFSQSEIVNNIAKMFNCTYDEHDVRHLCKIARCLVEDTESLATVATIFFALSYALSDVPLVISMLMTNINQLPIANCLDEFENRDIECKKPDLLSPIADTISTVCDNDIHITNCLAFDSMSKNIAKNTRFNEHNALLFGFLHHRHQLLFNQLSSFRFSDDGIIDDIKPLGFDTISILKTMERVNLREKWLISINDSYSSPFFLNGRFSYSSVEDQKMLIAGKVVKSICIDPTNNKNVIVATPPYMRRLEVSKDNLDKRYPYEVQGFYDSPFSPGLPRQKLQESAGSTDTEFGVKTFHHKVTALFKSGYRELTALDSHPTAPAFVAGNNQGILSMWHFNSKVKAPDSHVQFYKSKIRKVRFSERGDNLLVCDKDGRVYTTDFETNTVICEKPNATAVWFNPDSQVAVYQPSDSKVAVYDTRSGTQPVVSLELSSTNSSASPIDVWENQIAVGGQDGCVTIFDVRAHYPTTQRLHSDVVTCLKYHPSGSFIVSGSKDNSLVFTDAHELSHTQVFRDILPDYDRSSPKRGITAIALSQQAIVVGGHSPYLHVWTAFADAGSALTGEHRTTAVDLREK